MPAPKLCFVLCSFSTLKSQFAKLLQRLQIDYTFYKLRITLHKNFKGQRSDPHTVKSIKRKEDGLTDSIILYPRLVGVIL